MINSGSKGNWNACSLRLKLPPRCYSSSSIERLSQPLFPSPTLIHKRRSIKHPVTRYIYTHAARHSQSRAEALDSNDYSFKDQSIRGHKG